MTERQVYKVDEFAQMFQLCPRTVWNLVKAGRLRVLRIGRAVRIPKVEAERFVDACLTGK